MSKPSVLSVVLASLLLAIVGTVVAAIIDARTPRNVTVQGLDGHVIMEHRGVTYDSVLFGGSFRIWKDGDVVARYPESGVILVVSDE